MTHAQRVAMFFIAVAVLGGIGSNVLADQPQTAYIFPAGGQRGTTVNVRIGGYNLHDSAALHLVGKGVAGPKRVLRTKTVFFEGPVIPQPASQRKEDYPKDYKAAFKIAKNAAPGARYWRVSTSQGVTSAKKFIVGALPEVIENEMDGAPIPTTVEFPVTINGRIFPREDVDIWTFAAKAGQTLTCEVHAARLGSPLDSRLEVRGPDGKRIAENVDAVGTDSRLYFTAPKTGRYALRIHDVNFNGLQNYVYRLTITASPYITSVFPLGGRRGTRTRFELTGVNLAEKSVVVALPKSAKAVFHHQITSKNGTSNRCPLELGDLPEYGEATPAISVPAVLNGRIRRSGEIDEWKITAKKGEQFLFDLKAARLGSPLDSVLTIFDARGKQIAQSDDMGGGQTDSQLTWKVAADGKYTVRIQDRLTSRGGSQFAYRLWITKPPSPEFQLTFPADALSIDREKTGKLKLNVERLGGFKGEIELAVSGLPKGVTVTGTKIGKNKRNAQLAFKTTADAKIGTSSLEIVGKATVAGRTVKRRAVFPGEPVIDRLALCIAMPTPFKFAGEFETRYGARGSTYYRRYKLERNGFQGPITVSLADIQIRHLQGVKGQTIVVPPGKSEFHYPVTLPAWMEIGRTSRTCVMAVGIVADKDGRKHKVSYSSTGQNDQCILLVDPSRLSIRCKHRTIVLQPGKTIDLPIQIARGNGLPGPVAVELIVAKHIRGVTAKPVVIPRGRSFGNMRLRFASKNCGPFNMPLVFRATLNKGSRHPLTDESLLQVVVPGKPTPVSYHSSRK